MSKNERDKDHGSAFRGEVGSHFGAGRAYDHSCWIRAANSEGEGLTNKPTEV